MTSSVTVCCFISPYQGTYITRLERGYNTGNKSQSQQKLAKITFFCQSTDDTQQGDDHGTFKCHGAVCLRVRSRSRS